MKYAVIVDAYSAGNLLAPEFKRRGLKCIHVQSTLEIWPILRPSFREEDFEENLKFDGSLEKMGLALEKYPLLCVLPGTETGVQLADQLAEKVGVPGNGTAKSEARRNKFVMIETCRKAGLRVAEQFKSKYKDELVEWFNQWLKRSGLKKVVVKPIESAGTDKVSVCQTHAEVRTAVQDIIGSTNMLGIANHEALIQEFLEGTEYFLNTVSLNGRHHFTDIWRYQKRSINGFDCVYDKNILCSSTGDTEIKLQKYVSRVLDTLDVHFGPAHTEVMLGPDGPALIEIGTRLDGLSVPAFNQVAIGYSPVELTVDAFLDEKAFLAKAEKSYPILKHARTVYFTSYQEGVVEAVPGDQKVRSLSSFFQMRLRAAPGSKISKTTNYFTAPGFVSLAHPDPLVLEKEYQMIREWELEKNGFFIFSGYPQ